MMNRNRFPVTSGNGTRQQNSNMDLLARMAAARRQQMRGGMVSGGASRASAYNNALGSIGAKNMQAPIPPNMRPRPAPAKGPGNRFGLADPNMYRNFLNRRGG